MIPGSGETHENDPDNNALALVLGFFFRIFFGLLAGALADFFPAFVERLFGEERIGKVGVVLARFEKWWTGATPIRG